MHFELRTKPVARLRHPSRIVTMILLTIAAAGVGFDRPARAAESVSESTAPVSESTASVSDRAALDAIAHRYGWSASELNLVDRHDRWLESSARWLTRVKVTHSALGWIRAAFLDGEGNLVDGRRLIEADRAAERAAHGALHPDLRVRLESLSEVEPLTVAVWLAADDLELPARPTVTEHRLTRDEAVAQRRRFVDAIEPQLALRSASLIEWLAASGYRPTYISPIVPLLYVTLPKAVIVELARRDDVDTIYGPNENRDAVDVARETIKADRVNNWGFRGDMFRVAVIEDSRVEFGNPDLAAGITRVPGDPNVDDHATQTAGIVASLEEPHLGIAREVTIYSANATDYTDANLAAAIDWCLLEGVDVLNNSWSGNAGSTLLNDHDRHLDWVTRYAADTVVVAAGNDAGGCGAGTDYVGSPGKAYGVITVGGFNDAGTVTWDDDSMYSCSSSVDPSTGAEKPEVVAPAVAITSTTASTPWTGTGSGTSFASPMVAALAADLMEADPFLAAYPETLKAILLATALHNITGSTMLSEQDGTGGIDARAAIVLAEAGAHHGETYTEASFPGSYSYFLQAGKVIRAVVSWNSNPNSDYTSDPLESDLDLTVVAPDGTTVAISASGVNPFEIVEFVAPESGVYQFQVTESMFPVGGSEYVGFAVWAGGELDLVVDEPLVNGGSCNPPDHLTFEAGPGWNCVALQAETGFDYNLRLFKNSPWEDPEAHEEVELSTLAGDFMDFIVVDRNHAPDVTRYLEVREAIGESDRFVEHAESREDISTGEFGPYGFGADGMVEVFDVGLLAGTRKYLRVVPLAGAPDVGLFLFDSDPNDNESWAQRRSENLFVANVGGDGEAESFDYEASVTDWHGLVVANLGGPGSGSFKVFADVTAPTGTVTINGGLAVTGSHRVQVAVAAEDLDTGIQDVRVRESGGPWTTVFSAAAGPTSLAQSALLDLAPGTGLRTIEAQIRNNAGMVTSLIDTITLYDCSQPPGPLTNGDFQDATGFPWCFYDSSDSGFVSYAGGAAHVRGGDDAAVAVTSSFIRQSFTLVDSGLHVVSFAWSFDSEETGSGNDAAVWDLVDASSGASLLGGPTELTNVSGDSGFVMQALTGPGTFEIGFGTSSDGGGTGPGVTSIDNVVVNSVPEFRRADCNGDGAVEISDVVFGLDVLFGSVAGCRDACDVNDDGVVDISDPVYSAAYQFNGGPPPPPPFPACGPDATNNDPTDCLDYGACP